MYPYLVNFSSQPYIFRNPPKLSEQLTRISRIPVDRFENWWQALRLDSFLGCRTPFDPNFPKWIGGDPAEKGIESKSTLQSTLIYIKGRTGPKKVGSRPVRKLMTGAATRFLFSLSNSLRSEFSEMDRGWSGLKRNWVSWVSQLWVSQLWVSQSIKNRLYKRKTKPKKVESQGSN